jgi:hypothetical protein
VSDVVRELVDERLAEPARTRRDLDLDQGLSRDVAGVTVVDLANQLELGASNATTALREHGEELGDRLPHLLLDGRRDPLTQPHDWFGGHPARPSVDGAADHGAGDDSDERSRAGTSEAWTAIRR